MKLFHSLFVASFLAVSVVAVGCGSDDNTKPTVTDDGKSISSVEISSGASTLKKGGTVQLRALVKYADGSSKDISTDSDTAWNTSDAEVATVDNKGNVTAVEVGTVTISATYKSVKGEASFVVTP